MTDRSNWPVRKTTLTEQGNENDLANMSGDERVGMMWQLALDAWAMKGEPLVEPRLPRHVGRIVRGGR